MFCSRDLFGNLSKQFNEVVEKVKNFILFSGNPYLSEITVTLHNFTCRQLALKDVSKRLLSFFKHGQGGYTEFREHWFVTNLENSVTLAKKSNLPKLDNLPEETRSVNFATKTANKELGQSQRNIVLAR